MYILLYFHLNSDIKKLSTVMPTFNIRISINRSIQFRKEDIKTRARLVLNRSILQSLRSFSEFTNSRKLGTSGTGHCPRRASARARRVN